MATELGPQQTTPTNGLKRRQSEVSEQENKRLRASPGKTSPDPETTCASARRDSNAPGDEHLWRESTDKAAEEQAPQQAETRRKSSAVNEKDRSRRLFGGLLGSLSQKGDSRTTKRRQEIESRRKAELQRQDDEHLEDKQRRLEQLAEKRRRVKKELEAETMRNRHRDMLHKANFLHTSAQPRLLYKPWELRDEEDDRIDDQISEVKAQIDRELASFNEVQTREGGDGGDSNKTATEENPREEHTADTAASNAASTQTPDLPNENEAITTSIADGKQKSVSTEKDGAEGVQSSANVDNDAVGKTAEEEEREAAATNQDEHDDHIVEGEEDTVIY
ncbi:hypothetical protein MBLNU13_g11718t2 [Cladosporium sp. NU13]